MKVSIVKCSEYTKQKVESAVQQSIGLLGGINQYVKPGQTVFVKPNLAGPFTPESAVTTHPVVVSAVIKLVQSVGAKVIFGDSPAGVHNPAYLKAVYTRTGMEQVASDTGATLCYDTSVQDVRFTEGKQMRHFTLVKPIIDADVIINIPKLKTHMFTTFTGAVKNFYGSVPGTTKVAYHSKFQDVQQFSQLLLDLYNFLKPKIVLTVIDGIIGMEGNGPSWGKPKPVGVIVAGDNGQAVDWVSAQIIMLPIETIPTLAIEQVTAPEILGESLETVQVKDFLKPEANTVTDGLIAIKWIPEYLRHRLGHYLLPKPNIVYAKCIGCSVCADSCPQKTIKMVKIKPPLNLPLAKGENKEGVSKKAKINHKNCIRCWCCNEVCPQGAVVLKRSLLSKLIT